MAATKPEELQVEVQQADQSEHVAVHTDTFEISDTALGNDLSSKYFWNWRFIGLIIVSCHVFLDFIIILTLSEQAAVVTNNAYIIPYIYAANAIPEMVAEFGESVAINWIPLSYNLCYSVSLLIFGRFADVFGRRYFVVGAHVLAVLGTVVSATARNADTIVGGQVLTGLAAAVQSSFTIWLAERLFTISDA